MWKLILFCYLGTGIGLALVTMQVDRIRHAIDAVTGRLGMSGGYARGLWLVGTALAWPVGIYVALTGRLVCCDDETGAEPGGRTAVQDADSTLQPPLPSGAGLGRADRHRCPAIGKGNSPFPSA